MVWCGNQKGVRRLPTRVEFLQKTMMNIDLELQTLPEGRVQHKSGKVWRYYGPEKLKFLHEPSQLLGDLIRREYLEKVYEAAESELRLRIKYQKKCPIVKMEEVFDNLSPCRKAFIEPVVPSSQQFVKEWLNQPYPSHNPIPLDDKFPTGVASCPYVRSKSEILEVRGLDTKEVAFLYEFPLTLETNQGGVRTIYPDFTILNRKTHKVLFWEHFGRMDDLSYLTDFKVKQELYAYNGILGSQLYQTFETSERPLTMHEVDAVIRDIKRVAG